MEVDEAGADDEPLHVEDLGAAGLDAGAHLLDRPLGDHDVEGLVEALGGVDDPPALEKQPAHAEASAFPPRSR